MNKSLFKFLLCTCLCLFCCIGAKADDLNNDDFSYGNISAEVLANYSNGEYSDEVYYLSERACGAISKNDIAVFKKNGVPVAVLYQLDGRCRERQLTDEEYNDFVSYIQELNFDDMPDFLPYEHGVIILDGSENQYIHISKDKKSYVYMNNPGTDSYKNGENKVYVSVINKFKSLFETGDIKTYYDIDGAELLINSDDYCVRSVYKNGDDFRVLIKDKENSSYNYEKLEWHSFENGIVGDIVDEPDGFTIAKAWDDIPDHKIYYEHLNNYPWLATWGDHTIKLWREKTDDGNISGLFLTKENEEPVLICKGDFSSPVVIPGTDFVVCEEAENGWQDERKLVKINLRTSEKTDIDFLEAESVSPIICLDGKLLIGCKPIDGSYGYYMYDISDDTMAQVSGDFSCLTFLSGRALQPTSVPNKYYVLGNQHSVGIFDAETYKFKELKRSPVTIYNNDYVWVDEEEGKMYVVVNDDLISLPIDIDLSDNSIKVMLNGEKVLFDKKPIIENDRTLVPLRQIFEALGYEVLWNDEDKSIIAEKSGLTMRLQIGNTAVSINNELVYSDTAPVLIDSTTYVPIRVISENSGYDVQWSEENRTITINSK